MDKKKLLALAIFLIMGFFMITFANPSDQLTPVDNNANEPVADNTNANQTTPTDNAQNRPTTPAANAGTTTNTPVVTPVVDDNTDTQPTNDDEKNDPQVNIYTVTFVDHDGKALKIQAVAEHQDATASDIKVLDYTVGNMTYTFAKWDKDFTDVTSNLTVKALYNVKSIIAVVVIDGEKTDKTVEVYVNEDTENKKNVKLTEDNINDYINVEELPEENAGETNTAKELKYDKEDGYIIVVDTDKIDYTITGTKTEEGTVTVNGKDEITANIGDVVVLDNKPAYGYEFDHYVATDSDGNEVEIITKDGESIIIVDTKDIEVTAVYVEHEFDVTFKAHGYETTQKVAYKKAAVNKEDELTEANKNYEEAGWAYTYSQWDTDFSSIIADTVVNAVYTREAIPYTINYRYVIEGTNNEGYFVEGENTNQTSYDVRDTFRLVDPSKTGYDFVKWTEGNKTVTGITAGEFGERTFTAVFKPSKNNKYRVITYAERLEEKENAQNATDRKYALIKNNTYNYTAKATTGASVEVTPAAMKGFVAPAAQTKTIEADGSTTYTFFYDREVHTLTFKLNGEVMEGYPQTLKYGTPITAPTLSADEGYTLVGFGNVAKTMGETDLTYTATITPNEDTKYRVISYTQKLVVNPEADSELSNYTVIKNATYNYTGEATTNTKVTVTPAAMRGFVTPAAQEKTIAGDGTTVYEFFYNREEHQLSFIVDGNVMSGYPKTLRFGAAITAPTVNVPQGYTFSGFGTIASNMETTDLTYSGTITPNKNTKYYVVVKEEDLNGNMIEVSRTDKTGTTGETATATVDNKVGFTVDANEKSTTINGNGKSEIVFNYTRIKSTLTFTIKDTDTNAVETVKTVENVPYGARIASYAPTANDYTIAEGYNFSTWTLTGNMPAEAKTIEATKTIKKFTVRWSVDGRVVETDTNVTYGSKPQYNGSTPSKSPVTDESGYKYNYTFTGWKDLTSDTIITDNTTFNAELVTLKAEIIDGKQLSYTLKDNTQNIKNDIIVTVIDENNKVVKKLSNDDYSTDFDNTKLTYDNNKNLTISYSYKNNNLTNNKLFYEIRRKAFNTKFEVISVGNTYEASNNYCYEFDCSEDTTTVALDNKVLEVIEHYNQRIDVNKVTANYKTTGNEVLYLPKRSDGKPQEVRWTEIKNGDIYDPVYIAHSANYDYRNTFVRDASNTTVKHGENYPQYSYKDGKDMSGTKCEDVEKVKDYCDGYEGFLTGICYGQWIYKYVPTDCSYDYKYVARTAQTKNLYRIKDEKFVEYKPVRYDINMDDINTVTIEYYNHGNEDEHVKAGNYVVVFEYDRVLNKFVCIDEHEVK
ncbi:MAG: hypothetical protein E7159_01025 [Firmicutes bacterium]|nr:hypothetical protein [Bacillota bacterium]